MPVLSMEDRGALDVSIRPTIQLVRCDGPHRVVPRDSSPTTALGLVVDVGVGPRSLGYTGGREHSPRALYSIDRRPQGWVCNAILGPK